MIPLLFDLLGSDFKVPIWLELVAVTAAVLLGYSAAVEQANDRATQPPTPHPGRLNAWAAAIKTTARASVADRPPLALPADRSWRATVPSNDQARWLRPPPPDQTWVLYGFDDREVRGEPIWWAGDTNLALQVVDHPFYVEWVTA